MTDGLDLTRSFRDPIHGTIRLTPEEVDIIDHPLFLRLNHIRQNGLLYYVFPAATHTRFEHSVGVLHIADSVLRHVLANSHIAASKSPPSVGGLDSAIGKAIDFNRIPDDERTAVFRLTRLAALVHDLGHGPFSHTFDAFAPHAEYVASLAGHRETRELIESLRVASRADADVVMGGDVAGGGRVKHEEMSCVLFSLIWRDLGGDPAVPFDVSAVILGKPNLARNRQLRRYVSLIHDVVASAPADADRMDYLERDSKSIGVNYGLYDRNRVLSSFLCYVDDIHDGEPRFRLGVKQSGMRAVENLVQARFEMFVQIYFHKTSRAASLMLDAIAERARGATIELFSWRSLDDLAATYVQLSDERFLWILRGLDRDFVIEDGTITRIASDLSVRRLWKRIFDGEAGSAREVCQVLSETFPVEKLVIDRADPKPTKEVKKGASLLHRGRDGVYAVIRGKTWFDSSPLIAALSARSMAVERIYYLGNDTETSVAMRNRVRQITNLEGLST